MSAPRPETLHCNFYVLLVKISEVQITPQSDVNLLKCVWKLLKTYFICDVEITSHNTTCFQKFSIWYTTSSAGLSFHNVMNILWLWESWHLANNESPPRRNRPEQMPPWMHLVSFAWLIVRRKRPHIVLSYWVNPQIWASFRMATCWRLPQSCCPSCFIKCVLDRGAGKETSEMVSNQARQEHSMSVSAWYKSLSFSNGSRCFQSRKAALCSIQKQKMDCFHCFTHCKALIFNHLWCSYCISHKSNHTRLTRELMTILFIFQISPEFSNVQRVFVGSFVDHPSTIFVGKKNQTCQPLPTISPSIWSWHLNWTMRWSQIFSGQVSWDIQAVQVSF